MCNDTLVLINSRNWGVIYKYVWLLKIVKIVQIVIGRLFRLLICPICGCSCNFVIEHYVWCWTLRTRRPDKCVSEDTLGESHIPRLDANIQYCRSGALILCRCPISFKAKSNSIYICVGMKEIHIVQSLRMQCRVTIVMPHKINIHNVRILELIWIVISCCGIIRLSKSSISHLHTW